MTVVEGQTGEEGEVEERGETSGRSEEGQENTWYNLGRGSRKKEEK